jgi:exonuclease SbcD
MHFSDVHFGVENYGRFDPETGLSSRLVDFRNALLSAIDKALDAGVELAVFTGDAYKTRDPNQTHQREFASCLKRLIDRDVPVVLLAGNHDIPNTRGRANSIEIFGALSGDRLHVLDRPRVLEVATRTGARVQIAALPYLTKSSQLAKDETRGKGVQETTETVVEKYQEVIGSLRRQCAMNPGLPTIFMGHFTVSTAKLSTTQASYLTNEPQVPRADLAVAEFDYVALGHIHKFQDLNFGHQPPMVYSGSIERIDFGERKEAKGFVIADIARGAVDYSFVETETRPFVEIEVDTTLGTDDPTEKVVAAILKRDIENAIVKVSYKVKSEDVPLIRDKDIRAALTPAFMVVALHKDVVRDNERDRSALLTESLDPLAALGTYIDTREALKPRKDVMLEYARKLMDELNSDAAV